MLILFALFLSGVVFTVLAVWLLFKRRILIAGLNGAAGFSFLSVAVILALIFLNIHTYVQLTSEIELARVEVGTSTAKGIPIEIQSNDFHEIYYIKARQWQLDARFLKWKSWAYLLGTDPVVRLERLTAHQPFQSEGMVQSYQFSSAYPKLAEYGSFLSEWLGLVDTYYGSAVYMPAVEGSAYKVSATISGLIARADNQVAREAVQEWMTQ